MRQRIDLGAETIAFVRQRVAEIVGENQEGYNLSPSLRKHRRKIICDACSHRENHTKKHAENHTENYPEKYTKKWNAVARI